jgi:eukaryotic-like serine/threonine-protein kinase
MVTVQSGTTSEPLGGRYRVSELTERDQLGVVYRASDLSAGEAPRLVRVWLRSLGQDAEFRARLRTRSARLTVLAAQQPALPRVFSVEDTAEGDFLLVTDLVEGPSLAELLWADPPPDLRGALRLAIRVGEAIEAAHNVGLVHGCVVPAHVEICSPEQRVRLRGLEYGALSTRLLRQLDLDAPPFSRAHLAPEQEAGEEATEAGDIYAYARLLQELLQSMGPARRLPAGVTRALQGALASNPAERPRAIGEVLNDLWGEVAADPWRRQRRVSVRRFGPAIVLAALLLSGASLWVVHRSGSMPAAGLAAWPLAGQTMMPDSDGARTTREPESPPAMAVETSVPPVVPPPEPPRPERTVQRDAPAPAPPPRPVPAPARPSTADVPTAKRPAPPEDRPPAAGANVARRPNRPAVEASAAPPDPSVEPGRTVTDRPPRRPADEGDDPGSIIDWLLQESRTTRP